MLIKQQGISSPGEVSVFSVDPMSFVTARIRQSSCFPGSVNSISVDFRLNFDVTRDNADLSQVVISISGLASSSGSSNLMNQSVDVDTKWSGHTGADVQFPSTGKWNAALGVMLLRPSLSASGIFSGATYTVSWNISNPVSAQSAATSARIQLDKNSEPRSVTATLEMSNATLEFAGSVPGDAFPFKVYAPSFVAAFLTQASPWPLAQNSLTLTMVSNIDLTYPDAVTVSGLTGSTRTGSYVSVSWSPPEHWNGTHWVHATASTTPFESQVAWDQGAGTMILKLKDCEADGTCFSLLAGARQVLSFDIVNGDAAYTPGPIFISAQKHKITGMEQVIGNTQLSYGPFPAFANEVAKAAAACVPSNDCGKSCLGLAPLAAAEDAQPLRVHPARFLVKEIGQSSDYPNAEVTITVTFAANVGCANDDASCSGMVVIGNLRMGSPSFTGRVLNRFSGNSQAFRALMGVANWDRNTAKLSIPFNNMFRAGEVYVVALKMTSGDPGHVIQNATIQLQMKSALIISDSEMHSPGTCADVVGWKDKDTDGHTCDDYASNPDWCDGMFSTSGVVTVTMLPTRASDAITQKCDPYHGVVFDATQACCACKPPSLSRRVGQAAAPSLVRADLAQGSPDPASENVISVTLQFNIFIPRHAMITISGLRGAYTPSNDSLALSQTCYEAAGDCSAFRPSARWHQGQGMLTLNVSRASGIPAGAISIVRVSMRNPASVHNAVGPWTINVTRPLFDDAWQVRVCCA